MMDFKWNLAGNMFTPLIRAILYVVLAAGLFCIGVIVLLLLVGAVHRLIGHFRKGV